MSAGLPFGDEDRAHVNAVVAASGSSFTKGMKVLPAPKQDALFAIYAFAREVDDVADEPEREEGWKLAELARWRQEIADLYKGAPTRPTTRALAVVLDHYPLPEAEFIAVVDGMELDATDQTKRLETMDQLIGYCRRVAGAIGCLSMPVFSDGAVVGEVGEPYNIALGEAFQLTNILRDVDEDAERDRLYFPADLLAEHGVYDIHRPLDPVLAEPGFSGAFQALAARARDRFAEAKMLSKSLPTEVLKAPRFMAAYYGSIFEKVAARGWQKGAPRVGLTLLEKIWAVSRYGGRHFG